MAGQGSSSSSQEERLAKKLTERLSRMDPERPTLNEQCIYKVPPKIRQANPKAYTPLVVSIGPFHKPRGSSGKNKALKSMEDSKEKYLVRFLDKNKLSMEELISIFMNMERKIRSSYAWPIDYSSDDFIMMIVVDACFIIEHFLRIYTESYERDLLSGSWLLNDIIQDLTLLENQLPFFVLEEIFSYAQQHMLVQCPYEMSSFVRSSQDARSVSFLDITFYYFKEFNYLGIQPIDIVQQPPKHFSDLLRTFMQPLAFPRENAQLISRIKHPPSASQLSEAGLTFKVSSQKCLYDINYDRRNRVLEMPPLTVDDNTNSWLRNMLALEHCHYKNSPHLTQYLLFLDFLINTDKDVDILIDKKIIVNCLGDANAVARMFNNLCSHIDVPFISEKYHSIHVGLNDLYENRINKYKAIFYREYFNTPWKKASTIAAVLLLFCTLTQTICSLTSLLEGND